MPRFSGTRLASFAPNVRSNRRGSQVSRVMFSRPYSYESNLGKLPNFLTLIHPDNHLDMLVFHSSPAALIELREAFKKAGMRTQERQLTYAIEHTKQLQAWNPLWYDPEVQDPRPWPGKLAGKSESLFSYVLFELPSDYGMVPSRALATLGLLILVFALVYMVALFTARGRAGIWVMWPTDRVYQEEGAKDAARVTTTFFFPRLQECAAGRWWACFSEGCLFRSSACTSASCPPFPSAGASSMWVPGSPVCSPVSTCCAPPAGCGRCPASNRSSASICWPCGS
jgi:hypothetical protein